MPYFATKFSDAVTDVLYSLTMEWMTTYSGNSEAPTGWFTEPITITEADLSEDFADTQKIHELVGQIAAESSTSETEEIKIRTETLEGLVGTWIVYGDGQGFVYSQRFDTEELAQTEFDRMESEYGEWDDEDNLG